MRLRDLQEAARVQEGMMVMVMGSRGAWRGMQGLGLRA